MTSTDTLLPCEHCGCRFGYHEAGCAALVDDIVSVAVTGFKTDVQRILSDKASTPPTPATEEPAFNDHGCIYCRAQGSDCEGPHKFATDEREAVARALCEARIRTVRRHDTKPEDLEAMLPASIDYSWRDFVAEADAALSALAPVRAAEILAAEANGYAKAIEDAANEATDLWEYGVPAQEFPRRIRELRNEHGAGK